MSKPIVITIPTSLYAGLPQADRAAHLKRAKIYRRWLRRGWTMKGGADKRWAWIKSIG